MFASGACQVNKLWRCIQLWTWVAGWQCQVLDVGSSETFTDDEGAICGCGIHTWQNRREGWLSGFGGICVVTLGNNCDSIPRWMLNYAFLCNLDTCCYNMRIDECYIFHSHTHYNMGLSRIRLRRYNTLKHIKGFGIKKHMNWQRSNIRFCSSTIIDQKCT